MSLLSQIWESSEEGFCVWVIRRFWWLENLSNPEMETEKFHLWKVPPPTITHFFLQIIDLWPIVQLKAIIEKRSAQAISQLMGNVAFVPHSCLSLSRQMIHLVINLISIVDGAKAINHWASLAIKNPLSSELSTELAWAEQWTINKLSYIIRRAVTTLVRIHQKEMWRVSRILASPPPFHSLLLLHHFSSKTK